ncbi:MAG: hypothetical protein JXB23_17525 [Candidatus Aminicenantes bacterium]|nr:hypothetical protein [Candidatus Aminicenantes bacterium]
MKNKTSLLIKLHNLKCKLYKDKVVIDDNVKCSIDILRSPSSPIFKARGIIETTISLPVTSSDVETYSHFELSFNEPIEGVSRIIIILGEIDWDTKKKAKFESLSYKR